MYTIVHFVYIFSSFGSQKSSIELSAIATGSKQAYCWCVLSPGPSPIDICLRAEISNLDAERARLLEKRAYAEHVAGKLDVWLQDVMHQLQRPASGGVAIENSIATMLSTSAEQKEESIRELDDACERLWRQRKRLEWLLEEYRTNPPDPLSN